MAEPRVIPTWPEYSKKVPARMQIPLHAVDFRIEYVPVLLQKSERLAVANELTESVVAALRSRPECQLNALSIWMNQDEDTQLGSSVDAETPYISIGFDNPAYGFMLKLGPSVFTIQMRRIPLENLILSAPIFQEITQALFENRDDEPPSTISDLISSKIHRVTASFESRVRLGKRLSDENDQPTNLSIIDKLLKTKGGSPLSTQDYPLAALQPGPILRGDVNIGFVKEIASRSRHLWFSVDVPKNVAQRDVDITSTVRTGGPEAPLEDQDLFDFRTPVVEFYRDLVLQRFFRDLFHDVHVSGRL